jgi:hypothetical protein
MRALVRIAPQQAFCGHDLHQLQNGGVTRFALKLLMNAGNGARAGLPKDAENFDFSGGGTG